jgi:ABC-2 type transport system permease protein
MMAIWSALAKDGAVSGYTSVDFIGYYLVAIVVRRITSCNIVPDIENMVRTGELSAYLLRPVNVIHHFMAQMLTVHIINLPIVAVPVMIAIVFTPGIQLIINPLTLAVFLLSCITGFMFEFLTQYIIGGLSFWITQARGVSGTFILAKSLLEGYIVPLALFPSRAQSILRLLPFQSSIAIPVEILTGRVTLTDALSGIFISAGWVLLIGIAGWCLWREGLRSYSAVGA